MKIRINNRFSKHKDYSEYSTQIQIPLTKELMESVVDNKQRVIQYVEHGNDLYRIELVTQEFFDNYNKENKE